MKLVCTYPQRFFTEYELDQRKQQQIFTKIVARLHYGTLFHSIHSPPEPE